MAQINFNFIETPEKTIDVVDVMIPHLSAMDENDLQEMKSKFRDCDAVCLPPGYDKPTCNCKDNLA